MKPPSIPIRVGCYAQARGGCWLYLGRLSKYLSPRLGRQLRKNKSIHVAMGFAHINGNPSLVILLRNRKSRFVREWDDSVLTNATPVEWLPTSPLRGTDSTALRLYVPKDTLTLLDCDGAAEDRPHLATWVHGAEGSLRVYGKNMHVITIRMREECVG